MTTSLGELVRLRRLELGLTQEQLAERLGEGVRQSEVSRLERGHVSLPRPERLQCIAQVLDIPVGTLLMVSGWAQPEAGEADAPPANAEPAKARVAGSPWIEDVLRNARSNMDHARRILDDLNGTGKVESNARDHRAHHRCIR